MSEENVEAFRAFIEAFKRGDRDAVAASLDPDIAVRTDARWPEQRFYGRASYLAFLRGLWESWGPDLRHEEIVDLGDRLLTRGRWTIRGQHSGIEGEQWISAISTYRERRAIFTEFFLDREEALRAVGRSE